MPVRELSAGEIDHLRAERARVRATARRVKLRKIAKWLVLVFALAAYLNIGWALGTYFHTNVVGKDAITLGQWLWSGGFGLFGVGASPTRSLLQTQITFSIFWPLSALVIVGSWLVYILKFLLGFVFAGGLAKLLGLG